MSVLRMFSPIMKQPSTVEPVLLHSPPQNQTNPYLVGTRHPQHRGGNVWAIFSRNPAGTLNILYTPPCSDVFRSYYTPLHYISQKHPVTIRVGNAEHIPCYVKTKKEKKKRNCKLQIANCKWFFMATFATWLASSDLCFVPGARCHGPRIVNCKRDYELKWYEVVCTTSSLLFGCCRVFGLGLLCWHWSSW